MLALILPVFRDKAGFFKKGFEISRSTVFGIRFLRLDIYHEKRVTNPVLRRRVKKALNALRVQGASRAIVPDGFEYKPMVFSSGINIIDARPIYLMMLPELLRISADLLGIDTRRSLAVVHGGGVTDTQRTVTGLKDTVRFISVTGKYGEEIFRSFLEKTGISVMKGDVPAELYENRIDIYLDDGDGKILEIDGRSLSAGDIEFERPEGSPGFIPDGAIAQLYKVLTDNGLILPEHISVRKVLFGNTTA